MMKRVAYLLLAAALAASVTACGAKQTGDSKSVGVTEEGTKSGGEGTEAGSAGGGVTGIDFEEEPYTLHVCYPVAGEAQPDLPLVQEKLNEITLKEINVKVELEAISLFSMANTYALKASGQEKMDLICLLPGYRYLSNFANSNMIRPVDDLIDMWGPDIKEVLGEAIDAGVFNGKQYGIPENNIYRQKGNGFWLTYDLCQKYGIDIDSIKNYEDLEAVFQVIKENEPEQIVLMPEQAGSTVQAALRSGIDNGGTGYAQIVEEDGALKAKCMIESDQYMETAKRVRSWYEKGYISRDVATTQDGGKQLQEAGKCFAISSTSVIASMGEMLPVRTKCVMLEDGAPFVATQNDQLILWAVPNTSKRPEKAVQFLNLCFSNEEITNLMKWGIKDTHYDIQENGSVLLKNTGGWRNSWTLFGDAFKLLVRSDLIDAFDKPGMTPQDYLDAVKEWNGNVRVSPAYGFYFDTTSVKTEVAACDNVLNEFNLSIGNGVVDPVTEIPKFVQKLYDAGLQKILDEMQAQLDSWQAGK